MSRLRHGPIRWLTLVALVGVLAACGGDSSGSAEPSDKSTTTTADPATAASLTAQEVCDALPVDVVSGAVGLSVNTAEAGDSSATPQCAYTYDSDTGGQSNLTIASLDSTAVGGRTGDEAFDFVAGISREAAGGNGVEEIDVDAGDRAVRFTGPGVHVGIVSTDGHLLSVIVPLDADALAVDALLVEVASAVGT